MDVTAEYVLILSCPDRTGIVYAVAGFLADRGCNITDSHQFSDPDSGEFFMRVRFSAADVSAADVSAADVSAAAGVTDAGLRAEFGEVADAYRMDWQLHDAARRGRVLILVSQQGHCLNDLLYRHHTGALPGDVVAVVSNHPDCEVYAKPQGIPYHYLPVTPATRTDAEAQLLALLDQYDVDLVVLARYMQILSDEVCRRLAGRAINIHHSFLPSFKGGKPYHQAHDRGVKLIGATAHYVTADLDEGPIIEQEVARVDHAHSVGELVAVGRDLECLALARAVTWHLEHRVILNGTKTVVFR